MFHNLTSNSGKVYEKERTFLPKSKKVHFNRNAQWGGYYSFVSQYHYTTVFIICKDILAILSKEQGIKKALQCSEARIISNFEFLISNLKNGCSVFQLSNRVIYLFFGVNFHIFCFIRSVNTEICRVKIIDMVTYIP